MKNKFTNQPIEKIAEAFSNIPDVEAIAGDGEIVIKCDGETVTLNKKQARMAAEIGMRAECRGTTRAIAMSMGVDRDKAERIMEKEMDKL